MNTKSTARNSLAIYVLQELFSIYNALAVIAVCKYLGVKKRNNEWMHLKNAKVNGRVEVLPILTICNNSS